MFILKYVFQSYDFIQKINACSHISKNIGGQLLLPSFEVSHYLSFVEDSYLTWPSSQNHYFRTEIKDFFSVYFIQHHLSRSHMLSHMFIYLFKKYLSTHMTNIHCLPWTITGVKLLGHFFASRYDSYANNPGMQRE